MNCEEFRDTLVGDDAAERREAERHAQGCPECAARLDDDRWLAVQVENWVAATPLPRQALERRIAGAIERTVPRSLPLYRRPIWLAAAAAVVLLVATFLFQQGMPSLSETASIEETLSRIDRIGSEYARAIADLEGRAEAVLARAGDPDTPPEQAALLLSYRDRLSHLDAVIFEVQSYLEERPGHAGGHTVLLAAYQEKKEVLSALLGVRFGAAS
jgi:hypothetical protein